MNIMSSLTFILFLCDIIDLHMSNVGGNAPDVMPEKWSLPSPFGPLLPGALIRSCYPVAEETPRDMRTSFLSDDPTCIYRRRKPFPKTLIAHHDHVLSAPAHSLFFFFLCVYRGDPVDVNDTMRWITMTAPDGSVTSFWDDKTYKQMVRYLSKICFERFVLQAFL